MQKSRCISIVCRQDGFGIKISLWTKAEFSHIQSCGYAGVYPQRLAKMGCGGGFFAVNPHCEGWGRSLSGRSRCLLHRSGHCNQTTIFRAGPGPLLPRFLLNGFAVPPGIVVNVFFGVFASFWLLQVRDAVFCRFTKELYIKIVVIVNAEISVDKSLFFNRINCLHAKKILHKRCIGQGAKLYKITSLA